MIERRIGSGSTGTVYRARGPAPHTTVAIKVLAAELAQDSGVVQMFDEEANVGLQIKHPNIVQTLSVGREGGQPYIVFEFVHGLTLASQIQKGRLPEDQCLYLMRQLAQALRHLRQKGVVHQDIKPENILIEMNGNAKLTDLGFARVQHGKIDWSGFTVGTANYMSPEQADGTKDVDGRADLYALGATI